MTLEEAKQQFVGAWGSMGGNWGVNRTMSQIHALLMANTQPLSTEDIMQQLSISRGNANMNIRELLNWGLVEKVVIAGERKEFFLAEKNIWKIMGIIARERKKRELEPMLRALQQMKIDEQDQSPEAEAFRKTVRDMERFGGQAEKMLDMVSKADENWFLGNLLKWIS